VNHLQMGKLLWNQKGIICKWWFLNARLVYIPTAVLTPTFEPQILDAFWPLRTTIELANQIISSGDYIATSIFIDQLISWLAVRFPNNYHCPVFFSGKHAASLFFPQNVSHRCHTTRTGHSSLSVSRMAIPTSQSSVLQLGTEHLGGVEDTSPHP
jgi:hypothetical protein